MFITPPIKGEPKFITKSSIVWQPEESLKHGTEYKVTIKPVDLKDVPPNAAPFQFAFNVIPLEYQIKTFGLSSVNNKPEQMSLKGQLLVSDSISDEDAQSILSAKLENKSLIVEWLHESNGKEHNFIIRDITRDEFETSLVLDWNGDKLNIKSKGQKEIAVPSLKDFKITNIRVIDDSENDDPFVEVLFSDELDRKQNLNGLVKLAKNEANSFDICKKTLKEDVAVNVNFNDAKPQVKFVGKGTILPSNSILEIPFEAVGINAVEVTAFKIYPDNIGQFLQVNGISGDTEINRGGRYLWRKTIPLNPAEPNQWNRFSFDVTDLMKEHPGGLLRLTLSIKRRHSTFNCPGQNSPASQTEEQLKNWEDNGLTQASGWDGISDYYEEGQGNNYDWDERKNPCSDSYYTPQGENNILASQNFIASNIGLVTKQDAKGNLKVISTDLRTAKPLPGTEFEVRNFQGQVLSTGTSDGQGFADIKLTDTPFLLVAKKLEDTTYLKLNTKTALAVSHFDVGGETISKGIKGHIYGERGVWRPGDDIFLTFVLQNTSKDSTRITNRKLVSECICWW